MTGSDSSSDRWYVVVAVSFACLLAMSLWFSATAVVPTLISEWQLTEGAAAWLTMSVQLGFVIGAIGSALFNIPDLWEPRRVFAVGAILSAVFNALIPTLDAGFAQAVILRFATGMALAAVYPVGMKIISSWTSHNRGLAIGLLVGALTVGSASPHLVRAFGNIQSWEPVLYTVSVMAIVGGIVGGWAGKSGPYSAPPAKFQWRHMGLSMKNRPLRLANMGYLGHMWELYAMWTWIPLFLAASFRQAGLDSVRGADFVESVASLCAFVVIGVGGIGSLLAGRLADRWGRTRTAILLMAISGSCAASIGLLFGGSPMLLMVVATIWGGTIVADSAQFSASVSELSDRDYIGTQLTVQTAMGFLLTIVSIRLVPLVLDRVGWSWVFVFLAPGPALGIWAMWRLKNSSSARLLAGGRG